MQSICKWGCCILLAGGSQALAGAISIQNPGFEQGLDEWRLKAGTPYCVVSPEAARSGNSGLRVIDDSEVTGADLQSDRFPAEPGKEYSVRFWARCLSGNGVGVYLRFYDARGKLLTTEEAGSLLVRNIPPNTKEWKSFSLTGEAPPAADFVAIAIHSFGKATVEADFDDFEIEVSE